VPSKRCKSPACSDADCRVPAGRCHRDGCENDAQVATVTDRSKGWERGKPKKYCGRSCSGMATGPARAQVWISAVVATPCGCPTCSAPRCEVSAGMCHAPDCTEPAGIYKASRRDKDQVKGQPRMYCSYECAMRVTGKMSTRGPTEYWQSPQGIEKKEQMGTERRRREELRCSICGRDVERVASKARRAVDAKRRTFCEICWPVWNTHMLRAWHAISGTDLGTSEATYLAMLEAWTHGEAAQAELRKAWPNTRGNRPPIASDIAIEVMYQYGFQAAQIAYLITLAIERGDCRIPRNPRTDEGWVWDRVRLSGKARRRGKAAQTAFTR
jgi:hypothetical protein